MFATSGSYATGWNTGWSSAFLTSESGITVSSTPTVAGIQPINLAASGAGGVTGNLPGSQVSGNISGSAATATTLSETTYSVATTSGVAATLLTCPPGAAAAGSPYYGGSLYRLLVTDGGDYGNYGASALVYSNGSSCRITADNPITGGIAITLSGLNIQVTQVTGGNATVYGRLVLIVK
jgi:hypothetical protein